MGGVPVQHSTNHHPRPRLIILLLLVAGVVFVLYFLSNSSFNPAPVLLEVSILCLPFLVAMEGFYVVSGRTFAFFSFLFDTIFYAGLAMSRNEIYAWFKGSGLQSQGSLPASPKENAQKTAGGP